MKEEKKLRPSMMSHKEAPKYECFIGAVFGEEKAPLCVEIGFYEDISKE